MSEYEAIGLSRNGPELYFDVLESMQDMKKRLIDIKPCMIINCAAMVSIHGCNEYPKAEIINGILPKVLASVAAQVGKNTRFIQISTDHYYSGDKDKLHSENDEIQILNKYAETKRMGEL